MMTPYKGTSKGSDTRGALIPNRDIALPKTRIAAKSRRDGLSRFRRNLPSDKSINDTPHHRASVRSLHRLARDDCAFSYVATTTEVVAKERSRDEKARDQQVRPLHPISRRYAYTSRQTSRSSRGASCNRLIGRSSVTRCC